MSKYYLYAAAVQGIQDFIFKTNELRHIVGASELVGQICTSAFDDYAKGGEFVVRAAGNIKYVFETEEACKRAFREFPREIMIMAPGITVSQAVTVYEAEEGNTKSGDEAFSKAIDDVERILKIQRNKPSKSVLAGLMGIKRANNTGLPLTSEDKNGNFMDDATNAKLKLVDTVRNLCEKSFAKDNLSHKRIAYDISDIKGKNAWIAIVHADGNGLGKVVQKVGKNKKTFKDFSETLDIATTLAANAAYEAVIKEKETDSPDKETKIPIRPVVLSGDDMTVIIRGDLAIEYTKAFIETFEIKTKELLGNILTTNKVFENGADYLTACAGIAFIKSSYPFYYGYQLAKDLCDQAKKDTKALVGENDLPASCLMFHKVQDSFITRYEDIVDRELTVPADNPSDKGYPLFKSGPYYTSPQEGRYTVDDLEKYSHRLDGEDGNGVKSGIRNWITLRLEGKGQAEQRKQRMAKVFSVADKATINLLTKEDHKTCIAYDVLAYHTIMNQETNNQ